jgi:hypothetical protein
MDGLTASRLNLLGDPTRWKPIAGACLVTNEWLKLDQRTLFVERELGEVLKRSIPEGFCSQDFRWRWNALRLVLPVGLSRAKGKYSRAMFRAATCRTATRMGWGFTFTAGLVRTKNGPSPFTPHVGSTTRRCGHWRRRLPNTQPMILTPLGVFLCLGRTVVWGRRGAGDKPACTLR